MPFPEADCFRVYRDVRKGFPKRGLELGQGINEFPPAAASIETVRDMISDIASVGRINDYSGSTDDIVETACRRLLEKQFGLPEDPDTRIFFTNGASEGINLCLGAMSHMGLSAMLPQPSYYIYEQAMHQYKMVLAGRYRRDGIIVDRSSCETPFVLVQAEPCPLEGTLTASLPGLSHDDLCAFQIFDSVFLSPARSSSSSFFRQLRGRMSGTSFQNACLLVTPSKDLALPALRAGLIYTASPDVIEFVTRDQSGRIFSPSPLIGLWCLFYLCVINIFENAREQGLGIAIDRSRELENWLSSLGLGGWFSPERACAVASHLERMTEHCADNHARLLERTDLFPFAKQSAYLAGFSCFPRMYVEIENHFEMVALANRIGCEHGLFLNPSIVFGGSFSSWDKLYPGEARVRVNLSSDQTSFTSGLQMLDVALSKCGFA